MPKATRHDRRIYCIAPIDPEDQRKPAVDPRPELLRVLPTMLEKMAADIRADAQRGAN